MITIEKRNTRIEICGHAGYDLPGKDIVCAAISVLYQNLYMSIQQLTDDEIIAQFSSGNSVIVYKENLSERAQVLVDSFFIGCRQIAEQYPAHVRIV